VALRQTKTITPLYLGIGRDVINVGVSGEEADLLCRNDILRVRQDLHLIDPWIEWLDPVRLAAVTDLAWLMGYRSWANHLNVRQLLGMGQFDDAIVGLLKGAWARKEHVRINRACQMLLTGEWPWETEALNASPPTGPPSHLPTL
jgi:hypothetical protein